MTNVRAEVLLVGPDFKVGQILPDRLRRWRFRCHLARTARMACELLNSKQMDLVLSMTHLPDQSGFRLMRSLSGTAVTAFLCVPVEDSCLWLPAMDCGRNCWGSPALRPAEFARKLEELSRSAVVAQPAGLLKPRANDLRPCHPRFTYEGSQHVRPYSQEQGGGEDALTAYAAEGDLADLNLV